MYDELRDLRMNMKQWKEGGLAEDGIGAVKDVIDGELG
jgi:hypothetical protein